MFKVAILLLTVVFWIAGGDLPPTLSFWPLWRTLKTGQTRPVCFEGADPVLEINSNDLAVTVRQGSLVVGEPVASEVPGAVRCANYCAYLKSTTTIECYGFNFREQSAVCEFFETHTSIPLCAFQQDCIFYTVSYFSAQRTLL